MLGRVGLVGLVGLVGRVGLAGLFATCSLSATVMVPAELGELAADAHVIARGRIVAVEGFLSDDRKEIETVVTLEPESWLKAPGGTSETVRFKVPGGQVGRYRRIVLGAPSFAVGQRVVVFLGGRAPQMPHLVGSSQGVFRIARRAGGDTVLANRGTATTSLGAFEARVRALSGGAR
jgi:hypothetical protein